MFRPRFRSRHKQIWIFWLPPRGLRFLAVLGVCFCLGFTLALLERPTFLWVLAPPPEAVAGKIIVLDPGHGGPDPGCVGRNTGIAEKEIVLDIARRMAPLLKSLKMKVILTRTADQDLAGASESQFTWRKRQDLSARAELANQARAHLFVSIHANSFPEGIWSGAQTFYYQGSGEGRLLAEAIQAELVRRLGPNRRQALAADYRVIRDTQMPGVVVEVGFLSNPREEKLLATPSYRQKLAVAVTCGIVNYLVRAYQEGRKVGDEGLATLATTTAPVRPPVYLERLRRNLKENEVILYFEGVNPNSNLLVPEVRALAGLSQNAPVAVRARAALEALCQGPGGESVLYPTLPAGTRLLNFNLAADGTAYVNFSQEIASNHQEGGWNEELTVYSIVNTLTEFPEIKRVKILIAGDAHATIGGHVFLDQPFIRREEIISSSAPGEIKKVSR